MIALPAPPATTFSSTVMSARCVAAMRSDQLFVERLDEAQVHERCIQLLGDALARRHHRADGDDRQPAATFAAQLRLADRQRAHRSFDCDAGSLAARIAHSGGLAELRSGEQHLPALVLVGRRHHHEIRNAAQVRQVVAALVSRAVAADQAGAVDRERHGKVLQATSWIS